MRRRDPFGELNAFLAVAEERSFTRAAVRLGTAQSALSQTVRRLETRLGVTLLHRTTRSVAPTAAGEQLLESLRPAFDHIEAQVAELTHSQGEPAGLVRITSNYHAAQMILWPAVERLLAKHPRIDVELSIDAGFKDIVAERLDAGVRLGEAIGKDMVARRIGPDLRMVVVGSPGYFERHGEPAIPEELTDHRCIVFRRPTQGGAAEWEFERDGQALKVKVGGRVLTGDGRLILRAALSGHGLAYLFEDVVSQELASGQLVQVLQEWCPPFPGYSIYYPSARQTSPAFGLFLDALAQSELERRNGSAGHGT